MNGLNLGQPAIEINQELDKLGVKHQNANGVILICSVK